MTRHLRLAFGREHIPLGLGKAGLSTVHPEHRRDAKTDASPTDETG